MQRILIVSQSGSGTGPWHQELLRAGYPVQCVDSEVGALRAAFEQRPPQIIILDGTSARMSPRELRGFLQADCPNNEVWLLWLITEDEVSRLDPACGIDDFIILPATAHELLGRVRLHLWRTNKISSDDLIVAGALVIDQANYAVSVDARRLELTFKEYELLRFLVSHRGRVFTREALLNQVWGYDYYGGTRTVDVHIRRIRAKLGPEHEEQVETVRNVGYRFNA
jgi:DNA-binding response OmpR family regulator